VDETTDRKSTSTRVTDFLGKVIDVNRCMQVRDDLQHKAYVFVRVLLSGSSTPVFCCVECSVLKYVGELIAFVL